MPKVSVIGAGDVGASVAYTIQLSGLATEIVLLDANGARAEGHALDLNHGLFFTSPARIRAGGYADCAGSDVIVMAAGARQREGETRIELTKRNGAITRGVMEALRPYLGDAILVVVTNPVDVMTMVAARTSGAPPERVLGSGTVLDSARFRYELSHRCEVDPRNVHAYVIGEHGDSEVFLWSRVSMAGVGLEWFCPQCGRKCSVQDRRSIEKAVRESAYHLIEAKGYTNFGVSLAVRRIIGAILRDESSVLTVSAMPGGAHGLGEICLSLPCIVAARGIRRVVETPLADEERVALLRSAEIIREAGAEV
jgi:L-lactate dehydrogenase